MHTKTELLGMPFHELKAWVTEQGLPVFTASQLLDWMYQKHIRSFDQMTNLSKSTRAILHERATIYHVEPVQAVHSTDGTIKYLFPTRQGDTIEAVYIPDNDRATLCVSSQAGCKMGCAFCMTGRMGFLSQLAACEILNQILSIPGVDELTNVVFMGMGEPLDNLDEVLKALERLTAADGFGWSPKRITVSTIGVLPAMKRFFAESQCHLAVSLHTPLSDQRVSWMPAQKAWPLEEIIGWLKTCDFGRQRRLSFEYIVFKGLNDSMIHADRLAGLLRGMDCRVNLIRFHTIPDSPFASPDEPTIQLFCDRLNQKGIRTTIRKSRGEDIQAACGLLSTAQKD
jgi:23S rRNA (adenine2503-C2)-methyltransferase